MHRKWQLQDVGVSSSWIVDSFSNICSHNLMLAIQQLPPTNVCHSHENLLTSTQVFDGGNSIFEVLRKLTVSNMFQSDGFYFGRNMKIWKQNNELHLTLWTEKLKQDEYNQSSNYRLLLSQLRHCIKLDSKDILVWTYKIVGDYWDAPKYRG